MDPLDLMFELLVRAVRDKRPELLSRPFEVAELIELVPYRAVRAAGAVETNDDYSHALTRLLTGERGYLFADDLLQDDLRAELTSPNPDLTAWRAYTSSRVTISHEHARRMGETMPPVATPAATPGATPAATPAATAGVTPSATPSAPTAAPKPPMPKQIRPSSSAMTRPLDPEAETAPRVSRPGCRYCGQALPEDRPVNFCPSCGQNQLARRCAACSAELEPDWKFCVACGRLAVS
jgi:predicted RNA-binding Zn-ribbon protein involved in translation (DUF1610 family)